MSTRTGPGRPVEATWKASPMVRAMSSGLVTRKLCLVIGIVIPEMSASWKPSVPIRLRRHLPGDGHDRDRVHVGVGDRRHQVRRARAAGRHAHADPAGGLRVPGGRVAGALLVPDQDVPDDLGVEQRVVGRQDGAARDAEHHVRADSLERVHQRLRPGGPHLARAGDVRARRLGPGALGRDGLRRPGPAPGCAAAAWAGPGSGASAGRGWSAARAGGWCGERAARSRGLGPEGPAADRPRGPLRACGSVAARHLLGHR